MSDFSDTTPVTLTVTIDRGALEALLDNPLVLSSDRPGAFYANAVRRGIAALRDAMDVAHV